LALLTLSAPAVRTVALRGGILSVVPARDAIGIEMMVARVKDRKHTFLGSLEMLTSLYAIIRLSEESDHD
jgi:hypothetical protein